MAPSSSNDKHGRAARKHDDIIVAILTGLAVAFFVWLCRKAFARWNRVPKPEQAPRAFPDITQHFSPTINNTIQIPVTSVSSPSGSGSSGKIAADRTTLAELQTLLPEQGGIARLRHQQFWHHFEWTLDPLFQEYLQTTAGPNHKFLDLKLEHLRSTLYTSIQDLEDRIHRYSEAYTSERSRREFWKAEGGSVQDEERRRERILEGQRATAMS